jgi:hypothetical protein
MFTSHTSITCSRPQTTRQKQKKVFQPVSILQTKTFFEKENKKSLATNERDVLAEKRKKGEEKKGAAPQNNVYEMKRKRRD